jgi:hypothetical protein
MNVPIIDEVVEQLKAMPQPLQRQVRSFVRSIIGKRRDARYTRAATVAVCRFNSFG